MAATLLFAARFTSVGADAHWLVALGDDILANRRIPDGLPFAVASTAAWPNVLVLAEIVFSTLYFFGDVGLAAAQLTANGVALGLLVLGARRAGATERGAAISVFLVFVGALAAFVVIRLQVFSLVPFAALLLLLRADHQQPSSRIWWLVPLFALWSNLHGAVLMGFAVAGSYLLCSRLAKSPATTLSVGLASFLALWATPAGLRTGHYYMGVLGNEAASRGTDLWARPTLGSKFDVLLIVSGAILLVLTLRRRRPLWEYVAATGLLIGTALAARHGLWLLMLLSAPAATGMTSSAGDRHMGPVRWRRVLVLAFPAWITLCGILVLRGDGVSPVSPAVARDLSNVAGARTVLAPEPLVESLAVAGARVWASDPIDAFVRTDQAAYLDFLTGGPGASRAMKSADVVIVEPGTGPEDIVRADSAFVLLRSIHGWDVYERPRHP